MAGPEPWLRGTWTEVPAAPRAVLHALELSAEDLERWCGKLTDEEINARPSGMAPVAFHLRHIARSLDRLLTYAEGRQISAGQIAAMQAELDARAKISDVFEELREALQESASRVRTLGAGDLEEPRYVGRKRLPSTLAGLLVHCADHTQRHVGQAVTTAKLLLAQRQSSGAVRGPREG